MVQLIVSSVLVLASFLALIEKTQGHGMMLEPVGRSSRWRFNNSAPQNYDDNALYCGGFNKQWNVNNGKCGLCGDDYSLSKPRPNEIGGKYGEGVIVRSYRSGNLIPVSIKLTAAHKGYFYFNLCNLDKSKETEDCYKKNNLKLINGEYKFYVTSGSGWYNTTLQLPKGFTCEHCVLRWSYNAGNNWGICPNGTGAIGCGPQENFKSCADIQITSNSVYKPFYFNSDNDDARVDKNEEDFFVYNNELDEDILFSIDEVKPLEDFDIKQYKTKAEVLEQIKKLFLLILNEEQYLEIENTIERLGITDE